MKMSQPSQTAISKLDYTIDSSSDSESSDALGSSSDEPDFDKLDDDTQDRSAVLLRRADDETELSSSSEDDSDFESIVADKTPEILEVSLPGSKILPRMTETHSPLLVKHSDLEFSGPKPPVQTQPLYTKNSIHPFPRAFEVPSKSFQTSDPGSSTSGRSKQFLVTWGSKSGHQWKHYMTGHESIHINDRNGPVLHLYRDRKYFFCVEQDGDEHVLILTTSPMGGPESQAISGGFEPLSKGCAHLKVDKYTPRYFFYQCTKHTSEGGLVIVHDK